MRVFLRLRKSGSNNKQSNSCENLQELDGDLKASASEHTTLSDSDSAGAVAVDIEETESGLPGLDSSAFQRLLASSSSSSSGLKALPTPPTSEPKQPFSKPKGSWKTTGIESPTRSPLPETNRKPSPVTTSTRKRSRDEASQNPSVLESKKPAAATKMGLSAPGQKATSSQETSRSPWLNPQLLVTSTVPNPRLHQSSNNDPALQSVSRLRAAGPINERGPSSESSLFALELKKRGLELKEQEGDGNCLFRAVSLQVYGDAAMHAQVRKNCMDFMERDREHFCHFVTGEDFSQYIQRKRQDGVHGNNPEIQAISELFNRPIEVFSPEQGGKPLNIFHAEYKTDDAPIRLSYHDGNHYNAVIDPLVPTAGLGLGLPGLQPGLADKLQVAKAVAESDATADQVDLQKALKESQDDELQRALKESRLSTEHMRSNDAIAQSDVDATYFELEQAALEHSLQISVQHEHGKKKRASSVTQTEAREPESSVGQSVGSGTSHMMPSTHVASLPSYSNNVPPAAAAAAVASAPGAPTPPASSTVAGVGMSGEGFVTSEPIRPLHEYSSMVQEMVMNGFDLPKVIRAVELVGENFDDVLAFLMSTTR